MSGFSDEVAMAVTSPLQRWSPSQVERGGERGREKVGRGRGGVSGRRERGEGEGKTRERAREGGGGEAVSSGSRRRGGGRGEGRTCGRRGCGSRRAQARGTAGRGGGSGSATERGRGGGEVVVVQSAPSLEDEALGHWEVGADRSAGCHAEREREQQQVGVLFAWAPEEEGEGRARQGLASRSALACSPAGRPPRSLFSPAPALALAVPRLSHASRNPPRLASHSVDLRSQPQSLRSGRRRASARAHLTLPASLSITQLAATLRPRHLYLFCSTCSCCSHCNSATKGPCRRYTRASALSSPPRPNSTRFLGCRPHAPLSSARSRGVVEPRASCGNVSRTVARRQRQRNTEQAASRGVRSGTTSRKRVRAQRRKPERRSLQRQGCHQCCERSRMRPEAVRRAQRGVQAREGAPGRGRHSDGGGSSARRELKARAEQLCDQREAQ